MFKTFRKNNTECIHYISLHIILFLHGLFLKFICWKCAENSVFVHKQLRAIISCLFFTYIINTEGSTGKFYTHRAFWLNWSGGSSKLFSNKRFRATVCENLGIISALKLLRWSLELYRLRYFSEFIS